MLFIDGMRPPLAAHSFLYVISMELGTPSCCCGGDSEKRALDNG